MRVPLQRPSVRRAMLSIVVLAAFLAIIKSNYRPPSYGDSITLSIVPKAERTAEGMAAHERRISSPDILRRAELDPALAGLKHPLRLGTPTEYIGSIPGPAVYISIRSVEDGTLDVDSVAEGSEAEARAIVVAVADAYIADQGAGRIAPVAAIITTAHGFTFAPLSSPGEVATAMVAGLIASGFVLLAPSAWLTRKRLASAVVIAPAACVILLQLLIPFAFLGYEPLGIVSALIVSAALGLGAMRHPWGFLPLALLICIFAPVFSHGFNGASLAGSGSLIAWVIGATAGAMKRGI